MLRFCGGGERQLIFIVKVRRGFFPIFFPGRSAGTSPTRPDSSCEPHVAATARFVNRGACVAKHREVVEVREFSGAWGEEVRTPRWHWYHRHQHHKNTSISRLLAPLRPARLVVVGRRPRRRRRSRWRAAGAGHPPCPSPSSRWGSRCSPRSREGGRR